MQLQELIHQLDLDYSENEITGFFLGAISAIKPMNLETTLEELLELAPEKIRPLAVKLKPRWQELQQQQEQQLKEFIPSSGEIEEILDIARSKLEFYLTSLSLAGTNSETCEEEEELVEALENLEDLVMELDEYLLAPESASASEQLLDKLTETWEVYLTARGFKF